MQQHSLAFYATAFSNKLFIYTAPILTKSRDRFVIFKDLNSN